MPRRARGSEGPDTTATNPASAHKRRLMALQQAEQVSLELQPRQPGEHARRIEAELADGTRVSSVVYWGDFETSVHSEPVETLPGLTTDEVEDGGPLDEEKADIGHLPGLLAVKVEVNGEDEAVERHAEAVQRARASAARALIAVNNRLGETTSDDVLKVAGMDSNLPRPGRRPGWLSRAAPRVRDH